MADRVQPAAHPHAEKLRQSDGSWKYVNKLAEETSPYLLQHAHNPVDWYPWGEPAFDKARTEDKPIFLSVGYSTCYWCHVMERQVFEDPRIAAVMNEHFVNIKVDREERPDVDELYMTATQLITHHGGWPMSVFLTPPMDSEESSPVPTSGLKPFWAGTYIPPQPQHGMIGFPQLLHAIHDAWENRRQDVTDQAGRIAEAVREQLHDKDTTGPLSGELIGRASQYAVQCLRSAARRLCAPARRSKVSSACQSAISGCGLAE